MTVFRSIIGFLAYAVFSSCFLFIVGNAVAQALREGNIGLAILEIAAFPLTFFIYPFTASGEHVAWPLAEGTSFVPFLVAALIAYPVGTFIGGNEPID